MRTLFLFTAMLLASISSFCQQAFTLKISVPTTFPLNRLAVSYSDGLTSKDLKKNEIRHEIVLTGNLHSLYGSVHLILEADSVSEQTFEMFFFSAGNSSIEVLSKNTLTDTRLTNVFNTNGNGRDKMDAYCEKERKASVEFIRANNSKFGTDRALFEEARRKVNVLYRKQFSFINDNSSLFYSFRLYHQLFTPLMEVIPLDSMTMTFRRFPDSYKNTDEGQYLLSSLLKQDTVKNMSVASDFHVLDINQKTVSLKQLKGKYVILDFWATWCAPCMKEMPSLVKISAQYPEDKLTFVSVSFDRDTLAYTKARQRLPSTWKYILGDESIADNYGVNAIPVFFLIDPEGKIILKSQNGRHEEYEKLETTLKERLN